MAAHDILIRYHNPQKMDLPIIGMIVGINAPKVQFIPKKICTPLPLMAYAESGSTRENYLENTIR